MVSPSRRRILLALALAPAVSRAAGARRRVGILFVGDAADALKWRDELAAAMGQLGWTPDNLELVLPPEAVGADVGSRTAALLRERLDAFTADGTPATLALHRADGTTPIVTWLYDPVDAGLARSLAAPGFNVTGLAGAPDEGMQPKLLQLARAVAPAMRRLWMLRPTGYQFAGFALWRRHAQAAGLSFEERPVRRLAEFRAAFDEAARMPGSGVLLLNFGANARQWRPVVKEVLARRLPSFSPYLAHCEAGGLLSYQLDFIDPVGRRAAILDKILRGADPARVPFELPTHAQVALNKAAARVLGLSIPADLMLRTDRVYEGTPDG
jgi:putative tryptophan/tyrosine transport system substrate-binding protein